MKSFSIILIIIIICFSCDSKNELANKTTFQNPTIDTVKITLDSIAKQSFSVFTINQKSNEFIGFNNTINALEFFNLKEQKFIKRLNLDGDGPNAIRNITGLYYHNKDSIFTYSRGEISIINEISGEISKINIFKKMESSNIEFEPIVNNHFRLYYDSISKTIPFVNIYFGKDKGYEDTAPLLSFLDLKDSNIQTIPYFHTESFNSTSEFGFLNYPTNSKIRNGYFFVNQVYSPNTYKINLLNQTSKPVIKSEEEKHLINRNIEDWTPHAVESVFYNQLEKIERLGFFRFEWGKHNYSVKENGFLHKRFSIKFYNENFDIVNELELPKNTYGAYSWFVHNNQIFIQPTHPDNSAQQENEFILHKIAFK